MEMDYGTPKKLPDGRYYLKVTSSATGGRVMVQLNKVKLLTKFDDSEEVTLQLSSAGVDKITAIDADILQAAKTNCVSWFGKQMGDETLDAAYSNSIQVTKMNVSKASVKGQVVTKIYAPVDKQPLESSALDVGAECDIMLEFSGIWFMKKTFGSIWRIAQVRLTAPPKKIYPDEYLFQDDEVVVEEEVDDDYI